LRGLASIVRAEGGAASFFAGAMIVASLGFNFVGGNGMAYFVMVMGLCAIVWSLIRHQPIWRLHEQPSRLMFLLAWVLIAIAFALTAHSPAEFKYAGNFLMFFFFVAISTFLGRFAAPGNLERVTTLALAGSVLSVLVAMFQSLVLKEPRAFGFGSDPIWSAQAALIVGFISAAGWLTEKPLLPRVLYLLGPILAVVSTFLTGSRGPLLAAPALALLVILLAGARARLIFIGLAIVVGLVTLGLHVLFLSSFDRVLSIDSALRNILSTGAVTDPSAAARMIFWRIGLAAFLASPLVGYGWEHFRDAAYAYLPDHGKAFDAGFAGLAGNLHLHADILDLGVSAGMLGLIAYALVIGAPIVDALTSPRDSQFAGRRLAALTLSIGYFCCGLTYLMFGFEFHTTLYTVLAAILLSFCRDAPPRRRRQPD
jgi:O-antigen ligase